MEQVQKRGRRTMVAGAAALLIAAVACNPADGITSSEAIRTEVTSPLADAGRAAPLPSSVTYVSFEGDTLQRYAWKGDRIVFLTERQDLDPVVMNRMLGTFDRVYRFYASVTGGRPIEYGTIDGRLTIADVPSTCGAGCAYLGFTGIELQSAYFSLLYDGVAQRNEYDQVLFYEFGRNFWLTDLDAALAYKAPNDAGSIVTGYAVFMRFAAMDAVGVTPGPFGSIPFAQFRTEVRRMSDRYEADPSWTLANSLLAGQAPANPIGLGSTDLFAAFMMELQRAYGPQDFVPRLWQAARARPAAQTTQDAVDNLVIAASVAARRNLAPLFTTRWRWTLSSAARSELALLFP